MRFLRRKSAGYSRTSIKNPRYRIALYCPDDHISYNGHTPDEKGVGGGITARVRVLKALAQAGHDVVAYVHCDRPGWYDGVLYQHFSTAKEIEADVFIATTSGGKLSFEPLRNVRIKARLRIVWVHGTQKPKGLELVAPGTIYTPSNFIRAVAIHEWSIPPSQIFVTYNGIDDDLYRNKSLAQRRRNPYSLVYLGYPGKGLHHALDVLRRLREQDRRFHLHVYGDYNLWGQREKLTNPPEGVFFHGTVPQRELIPRLFEHSFLLALQDFEEPFGISIIEAKRAGIVPVASAVGALLETIRPGVDGVLVEGKPDLESTRLQAARHILDLVSSPDRLTYMRNMAMQVPWTWKRVAQTWVEHWNRRLHPDWQENLADSPLRRCMCCGHHVQYYPDGWHCNACGYFSPKWNGLSGRTKATRAAQKEGL